MYEGQKLKLRKSLQDHADSKTKAWWENYVKGSAPFMGVKMTVIRAELHRWHKAEVEGKIGKPAQLELALSLFDGQYTEEKLAGILFLQEILLPANVIKYERDIARFATLFKSGRIYDWNVCDWFCVKVLGPLIRKNGIDCANLISEWRDAKNLWLARASLVPFVKVADNAVYYPIIKESCRVLIRREERFAKTAVGWILRDISKYDELFVCQVIEENIGCFSAESLKNATKYFTKETQKHYGRMRQNA